jgi:hypothetical protein
MQLFSYFSSLLDSENLFFRSLYFPFHGLSMNNKQEAGPDEESSTSVRFQTTYNKHGFSCLDYSHQKLDRMYTAISIQLGNKYPEGSSDQISQHFRSHKSGFP